MSGRYQAYPEYKDSGVKWFSKIPKHWKIASLSKLFKIKAGGDVNTELFSEIQSESHPYPIYTNANDEKAVYGYTSKYNFSPNTITVSGRGEVGFASYRDHAYDAIIRLLVLSAIGSSNCKFFTYFINGVIDFRVESSAIGQLSTQQISPYKVAFPSIDEQQTIANFLDHETAKIDTLIEKQQQLIKLLKEKRQAVISHAVTKGLNPNVKMKDSGVEWLGEVPEHWKVCKSKHYLSIISGFAFPSTGFSNDESDTKLLRGINVGVSQLKWDETVYWRRKANDGLDIYEISDGDLVIGMDRPLIGEGVRVSKVKKIDLPCLLLKRVASLKTGKFLNTDYLFSLLSSEMFVAHFFPDTTGVSVPHISPEQINNFLIPVPPISEQDEIVKFIYSETVKLDILINKAITAIELMQERRTALISAAVTGKIDVRNFKATGD